MSAAPEERIPAAANLRLPAAAADLLLPGLPYGLGRRLIQALQLGPVSSVHPGIRFGGRLAAVDATGSFDRGGSRADALSDEEWTRGSRADALSDEEWTRGSRATVEIR
ncbi:unnamed protein product [Darwinula stevensoni]|uniref:Uncharacterized protein n=1 Tax=Darwinula stevensoni TaxID=69355 RepID=A0A7R8XCM8_9CRUS|nr:unnamed protein product [Darwinula stevensoni]CAG0893902.1 unnamed protein product [Darwinula stevensoni]